LRGRRPGLGRFDIGDEIDEIDGFDELDDWTDIEVVAV
jgi:hypothetical protein